MRHLPATAAAAVLTVLVPLLVRAEDSAEDSRALQEVVITARNLEDTLPEQLAKSGVKVDVIQKPAISAGGYQDVAGALQSLAPGLFILPKNGPFDYVDLSLLGSRTGDVLFLVDGVRFNNRLYHTTSPLDTMPAGIVSRIEVLSGGQALFYGTQAVAGAVNIVTTPFTDQATGSVTLSDDSHSSRHIDANFATGTTLGQIVVYGSKDKSDGYDAFRPQDNQPSATDRERSYDVGTYGAKYGIDVGDDLRFAASYQHTDADLDFAQAYRVARNANTRKEDIATVKVDWQVGRNLGVFVKGYYHNWHTTYDTFYNDLAVPGQIDVLYDNTFWGYKDRGVNALGKLDIAKGVEAYFGYDLQSYGGRDEVLVIEQHNEVTQAVFGQLRITPGPVPNLTLAAGLRYNHPNVGETATIWNLSGQYDLPANLYVKGEVGTNFRLPDAEELFANDPDDELGNPNLKPERSTSVNLSFGGNPTSGSQQLHWELTGFARDITNLIDYGDFNAATNQDVFDNVPGTVHARGGQALVSGDFGNNLAANANYTFNTTKTEGVQLERVPKGLFKAGIDLHPADQRFGVTATLNYSGDVTRTVAGTTVNYGNYTVVDLSGRYFLDAGRHQVVNLSIRNLLDREYGLPGKSCRDVNADASVDGPNQCTSPYVVENLGEPRTFAVSYTYKF